MTDHKIPEDDFADDDLLSVSRYKDGKIFTANAARLPVDTAPATTNPTDVKQNGHIVHLLGGQLNR